MHKTCFLITVIEHKNEAPSSRIMEEYISRMVPGSLAMVMILQADFVCALWT